MVSIGINNHVISQVHVMKRIVFGIVLVVVVVVVVVDNNVIKKGKRCLLFLAVFVVFDVARTGD